jgi:hypothetical protein
MPKRPLCTDANSNLDTAFRALKRAPCAFRHMAMAATAPAHKIGPRNVTSDAFSSCQWAMESAGYDSYSFCHVRR